IPPRTTVRSLLKGNRAKANRGAHSCCLDSVVQSYLSPKVKLARRDGAHLSSTQTSASLTAIDSSPEPVKLVIEKICSSPTPRNSIMPPWWLESNAALASPPPNEIWWLPQVLNSGSRSASFHSSRWLVLWSVSK